MTSIPRLLTLLALSLGMGPVFGSAPSSTTLLLQQSSSAGEGAQKGWLNWRGPDQNGTSPETGLVDRVSLDEDSLLWSLDLASRGTPVVAKGRVFGVGYSGKGPDLQEVLFCLDQDSGKVLWEHRFADFLSDLVYTRYAIGSPTIDPATGNVFALTAAGLIHSFTPDGELLWQRSMMEELGRLTFPNGRTGAPLILGDTVIIHFIFASWGSFGPARDRFFAFDKHDGRVLWGCTPGGPPKDSSFCMPVLEERGGRTLMYAGLGGGNIVCVDARSGDPVWRYPFCVGGVNSSALIYGDKLIVVHGKENLDSSVIGRMACLDLTAQPGEDGVLPKSAELWRQDLVAFTSSPVLVGNRVYITTHTGELHCVDADTGKVLWHLKLGPDQLHASPIYADGKLYIPLTDGTFHIVKPGDEGGEVLSKVQLEGSCLGAPAISGGRILVHTTKRLYCFGERGDGAIAWQSAPDAKPGAAQALQLVPFDITMRVGDQVSHEVRRLDGAGLVVDRVPLDRVTLEPPAVATVGFNKDWLALKPGVGVAKAKVGDMVGTARLRVVPALPHVQTFDEIELDQADATFAFPPGNWFGGRPKWRIEDRDGERVVTRNMSNPLFQRTMSLCGHPNDANYTMQVDVMSDGNRRTLSTVGVVHQRYLIRLKGNDQALEVSSNDEHFKVAQKFRWKAKTWYRLKTKVEVQDDQSALIRAKVWPRDEAEPEAWTLTAIDPHGHQSGAWGLYGFTLQSRFSVFLDNLSVIPNE